MLVVMSASFLPAKANTSHSDTYIHSFTVYSNHDRPQDNHVRRFLQRHGIPYHYLPTAPGNKREQEILELIQGTDFVVLARYMQVKSASSFFFSSSKNLILLSIVQSECQKIMKTSKVLASHDLYKAYKTQVTL